LRTLLNSQCRASLLFSDNCALFAKNTGGWGSSRLQKFSPVRCYPCGFLAGRGVSNKICTDRVRESFIEEPAAPLPSSKPRMEAVTGGWFVAALRLPGDHGQRAR
jgi:hypothetical protein